MTPTMNTTTPTTAAVTTPAQQVVGSYPTYQAAEQAVDYLSDHRFPVQHVTIVGRGLHSYEEILGRLTLPKAAGMQAAAGALLGALLGWLLGMFDLVNPLVSGAMLALWGALIGAVLGGIGGAVAHALTGGRRDFTSTIAFRADSYEILVDDTYADQARRLLTHPGAPARD
ncbi:general stress protein [Couchioplanes azureus]|uniref:general stress protein n=1 Tax=Couchioplanes caeruleus TaxID=56438 RepID=UPI0019A1E0A6|nr:general stress protein [Couchioplanes caeruleus]GGQ38166.1 membrane protein [Couchioplanes caeruleus subsp. azureus]